MLSVVVPVFNEEESLVAFYTELLKIVPSLDKSYEIIFIDDGSSDKSLEIIKAFEKKNKNIRAFSFRRNLGKSEALTLGFEKANGDFIVTLDADLQDKPTEIYKLLNKAREGIDLVCGWRKDRKDNKNAVLSSKIFNIFAVLFWGLKLHDYNCGLKVYSKDLAKNIYLYGGMHRFIPLLAYQKGFSVSEVEVVHETRKFGESKYAKGFVKIFKNLPDMFTMLFLAKYSKRPLHFFGSIGIIFSLIGTIILTYLTYMHYIFGETVGRRPILFIGILFIISGLQTFFTGFLADLMINISHTPRAQDSTHFHFPLKYSSDI